MGIFICMRQNTYRNERGFTLIEMMVVVAIIAILVALLVPNFVRARAQAQTAACEANLKEIATALELYDTDNQAYPNFNGTPLGQSSDPAFAQYLQQIPVDPAAGPGKYYSVTVNAASASGPATYTITCPGVHDPATLQSVKSGTSDTHIQYDSRGGLSTSP